MSRLFVPWRRKWRAKSALELRDCSTAPGTDFRNWMYKPRLSFQQLFFGFTVYHKCQEPPKRRGLICSNHSRLSTQWHPSPRWIAPYRFCGAGNTVLENVALALSSFRCRSLAVSPVRSVTGVALAIWSKSS
jgi:hypothetical protein